MGSDEKLEQLILQIPEADESDLAQYLEYAEAEIIRWLYHKVGLPDDMPLFPAEYDGVSIQAVVVGYNMNGAESQSVHIENGIHRHFRYADMVDYIHRTVVSYARVV